jgi:hypothetical protein
MEKKDKERMNKDCFQDLDISAQRHPLLIDTSLSTSKRYRTSLAGRFASEIPARRARGRVPPSHNYPAQFPGRPHKKKDVLNTRSHVHTNVPNSFELADCRALTFKSRSNKKRAARGGGERCWLLCRLLG